MAERALNSYTCKLTEDQAAQLEAHLLSHNYEMRTAVSYTHLTLPTKA